MRLEHLAVFFPVAIAVWFLTLYVWPRLILGVFKRAILTKGFGGGPIPINTLYTQTVESFADPLHGPAAGSRVASTGVNRDTLLTVGWLDLSAGPQILHVPDMAGRYYAVQFTDPRTNTNFAYVGKRTTGTAAGDYLVTGPRWSGDVPAGVVARISAPRNGALVVGRVLVYGDSDIAAAHALASQLHLTPLR